MVLSLFIQPYQLQQVMSLEEHEDRSKQVTNNMNGRSCKLTRTMRSIMSSDCGIRRAQETIPSTTTGPRDTGYPDSYDDSRSAYGVQNAPDQHIILVVLLGISYEGVSISCLHTMRTRRQLRRQERFARTVTRQSRMCPGLSTSSNTCIGRILRHLQRNFAEESANVIRGAWKCQSKRDQEGCTPTRAQGGASPGLYPAKNPTRYEVRQTKMGDRRLGTSCQAVAFQSRTDGGKGGVGLETKASLAGITFPSKLKTSGETTARMDPAQKFSPPPCNVSRKTIEVEHLLS